MIKRLISAIAFSFVFLVTASQQIARAEYFFNTDPGQGSAIALNFSAADSVTINQNIIVPDSLSAGINVLFVRVANSNGTWSFPEIMLIWKSSASLPVSTMEYFFDTDPGIGSATPLAISTPADSIIVIQNIPVPALSLGTHKLYVRTKNADGSWSFPEVHSINICTGYGPKSEFESFVQSKTVYFSDSSSLPNNYYWNFGDGQTSTQANPKHEYATGGSYLVTLATGNSCGTDTLRKTIHMDGIQSVYPNFGPTRGGMVFEVFGFGFTPVTEVKLHKDGNLIPTGKVIFADSATLKVNCINDSLPPGLYDVIAITGTRYDTLNDAITIEPPSESLWFNIDAPNEILINRYNKFYVRYGNTGNSVLTGVPVYILVPPNASVLLANPLDTTDTDPSIDSLDIDASGFLVVTDSSENLTHKLGYFIIPYIEPHSENTIELEINIPSTGPFEIKVLHGLSGYYSLESVVEVDTITSARTMLDCNSDNWSDCAKCLMNLAENLPQLDCVIANYKMLCKIKKAVDEYKSQPRTFKGNLKNLSALIAAGKGVASAFRKCVPALFPPAAVYKGLMGAAKIAKGAYKAGKDAFDMTNNCGNCFKDIVKKMLGRGSWDPNIKLGPLGHKEPKWISGREGANYSIRFENLATATAPASEVVVTDTLDITRLNASSFTFTGYGFGDSVYNFYCYDTTFIHDVDLRPGKNVIVRTSGKFEPLTGALVFKLSSLDPATMQLTNVIDDGFLPPNEDTVSGQGYVSFIIQPNESLVTTDTFSNIARIIFDANPPINTASWNNSIDKASPVSNITSATKLNDSTYLLHISGNDDHSGIKRFNIYYARNNNDYEIMQMTDSLHIHFMGQLDSVYKFYSIAIDSTDNYEQSPPQPDLVIAVVLPVTIFDFQATRQDKTAVLRWKTGSEINNLGFEIQRSIDGINYYKIGFVNGNGFSNSLLHYSFIDLHPHPGRNYYRLKQIDFDNNFKLSPVRKVDFATDFDLSIFPNPVKNILTVQFTSDQNKQIKIQDILGRIVWTSSQAGNLTVTIPVQSLAKGAYALVVTQDDGRQTVRKFVKE
jgi:PKD repeat protein